jgi:hypothetical protein
MRRIMLWLMDARIHSIRDGQKPLVTRRIVYTIAGPTLPGWKMIEVGVLASA